MKSEPTKAQKLTEKQRLVLAYLVKWAAEGALPSSHMRFPTVPNPGAVLARLASRGLVEALGVSFDNCRCYAITPLGRQVLADAREREAGRG